MLPILFPSASIFAAGVIRKRMEREMNYNNKKRNVTKAKAKEKPPEILPPPVC